MRKIALTVFIICAVAAVLPIFVGAQGKGPDTGGCTNKGPDGTCPDTSGQITLTNPLSCNDVGCVWNEIYKIAWTIGFMLCTVFILVGGYQLMFSAGNPEKVESGKKTILYAVIGLGVLILASSIGYILADILGAKK